MGSEQNERDSGCDGLENTRLTAMCRSMSSMNNRRALMMAWSELLEEEEEVGIDVAEIHSRGFSYLKFARSWAEGKVRATRGGAV